MDDPVDSSALQLEVLALGTPKAPAFDIFFTSTVDTFDGDKSRDDDEVDADETLRNRAEAVYEAALDSLQEFLRRIDPRESFQELQCVVTAEGGMCWTAQENILRIEEEARAEQEEDIREEQARVQKATRACTRVSDNDSCGDSNGDYGGDSDVGDDDDSDGGDGSSEADDSLTREKLKPRESPHPDRSHNQSPCQRSLRASSTSPPCTSHKASPKLFTGLARMSSSSLLSHKVSSKSVSPQSKKATADNCWERGVFKGSTCELSVEGFVPVQDGDSALAEHKYVLKRKETEEADSAYDVQNCEQNGSDSKRNRVLDANSGKQSSSFRVVNSTKARGDTADRGKGDGSQRDNVPESTASQSLPLSLPPSALQRSPMAQQKSTDAAHPAAGTDRRSMGMSKRSLARQQHSQGILSSGHGPTTVPYPLNASTSIDTSPTAAASPGSQTCGADCRDLDGIEISVGYLSPSSSHDTAAVDTSSVVSALSTGTAHTSIDKDRYDAAIGRVERELQAMKAENERLSNAMAERTAAAVVQQLQAAQSQPQPVRVCCTIA